MRVAEERVEAHYLLVEQTRILFLCESKLSHQKIIAYCIDIVSGRPTTGVENE